MPTRQTHADGINCSQCSSRVVRTIDSRANGTCRRRRYQCQECLARFSTAEIPWEKHKKSIKMEEKLKSIYKTIGSAIDA